MNETIFLIDSLPSQQEALCPPDYLDLTWEERCKPRHKAVTAGGVIVALTLSRGTYLSAGTVLHNSADLTIVVRAKPEPVLVIQPRDLDEQCRVAHQLGNWHRSIQISQGAIIAFGDQPLIDWLKKAGIPHQRSTQPFEPNLRSHSH